MDKTEKQRLTEAVVAFSAEMLDKLWDKMDEGFNGWDDPQYEKTFEQRLLAHVGKLLQGEAQEADIANFAMFIWSIKKTKAESDGVK